LSVEDGREETEMTMGPVQLLVVGFDDPQFHGQILAELDRLRESEVVRLVDLLVVRKDDEGNVERLQRTDLTPAEAEQFGATVGALIGIGAGAGDDETAEAGAVLGAMGVDEAGGHVLGEDDFWYADDAIPNGSAAAIALIEHRWALGLRDAIREAGGFHLADAWVHPADLIAVGLLAAEEAAAH
jgi:uncharacterized membrane protein